MHLKTLPPIEYYLQQLKHDPVTKPNENKQAMRKTTFIKIQPKLNPFLLQSMFQNSYNGTQRKTIQKKWTPHEERILLDLQKTYGNHWTKIAKYLPGRSRIAIKHRFRLLQEKQSMHSNPLSI